jgi:hypothetical protein
VVRRAGFHPFGGGVDLSAGITASSPPEGIRQLLVGGLVMRHGQGGEIPAERAGDTHTGFPIGPATATAGATTTIGLVPALSVREGPGGVEGKLGVSHGSDAHEAELLPFRFGQVLWRHPLRRHAMVAAHFTPDGHLGRGIP